MATAVQVERKTYSVDEVAAILGIGRASVYAAIRKGELAAIRLGNRRVVAKATIDAMLEGQGASRIAPRDSCEHVPAAPQGKSGLTT